MDDRGAGGLSFGQQHFGTAQLGDRRRTKRLVQVADRMVMHPGGTLPEKVNDPANLKALYRLMGCPAVTHEAVLAPARRRTFERMRDVEGTVLLVHDLTELDYSGLKSLEGLGQIGNGYGRGYLAHHTLAILAETREVIGLAYQKLAKRPTVKRRETRRQRQERPDRESRLWKQASAQIPPPAAGRQQVEVADRGGDLLEFLDFVEASQKHYLVRSKHNRRICRENGEQTKLHDFARALPAQGQKTVEVPARDKRAARTASVSMAWSQVTLLIPVQPRGEVRGVSLTTWVICVREVDAPAGVEPLEWILLTNVPLLNWEDALQRIGWYECRWIIEEYHKALKTGCGVETLQLTAEERLKPTIALLSVVALFLLNLRDASRRPDAHHRPASELFPELFVRVLSLWRYKQPRRDLSVHEFYYALARLGGHQNRQHDHQPGWLVLWRGWTQLQPMVATAAALELSRSG